MSIDILAHIYYYRSATMTAVWPRGLPAASTTYHLRTILTLFAIKVDMVLLSFLCSSFEFRRTGKALHTAAGRSDTYSTERIDRPPKILAVEGSLYFYSKSGTILCEQIYLEHKAARFVNIILIYHIIFF